MTDENLCRDERVHEVIISEGNQGILIQRDYHLGQGCWSSVNVDTHELRACDRNSGAITTLTSHLASAVVPSPDEDWLAFQTFEWNIRPEGALPLIHIYRVQPDGSDLRQLDREGLPPGTVGAQLADWSADGVWLNLKFWDGTEDGWHAYRLKSDGSGVYELDTPSESN